MIRFGVEVSDIVQTIEELRRNATELLSAINEKDSELAHADLMCLKLTLGRINEQVSRLMRLYEMALADDAVKQNPI